MAVLFTRARHPQLPSVVMPLQAVEHCPDWAAYGEASTDIDALYVALALEMRAKDPVFAPPAAAPSATPAPAPVPAVPPKAAAPGPAPSAPVGADPEVEQ